MIIVDRLLEEREREGRPVRVAMVGAGFMGQGLANQIINSVPGMRMVAISNRNPFRAEDAYRYAGVTEVDHASSSSELEDAIRRGRGVVTDDPLLLASSEQVDVLVDVTGSVEYGAHVVLEAFAHGVNVVLMNAEIDAKFGPILAVNAPSGGCAFSLLLEHQANGPIIKSDIGVLNGGGEQTGSFNWTDVPAGSYVLQEDKTGSANCMGAWSASITY